MSTGTVIPKAAISGQPVNREEQRELASNLAQIQTPLITPLKEARINAVLAVQSAEKLGKIVESNPGVQTFVGGKLPQILKATGLNISETDELLFGGVNQQQFNAKINELISQSQVGQDASDAALYYASFIRVAFVYASSRLGQSGQGLSNKDFIKALEIVAAGKGDTFIKNLKSQTKEIVQISDTKIADFKEDAAVRNFEFLDQRDLLSGYKQTTEEFATSKGLVMHMPM